MKGEPLQIFHLSGFTGMKEWRQVATRHSLSAPRRGLQFLFATMKSGKADTGCRFECLSSTSGEQQWVQCPRDTSQTRLHKSLPNNRKKDRTRLMDFEFSELGEVNRVLCGISGSFSGVLPRPRSEPCFVRDSKLSWPSPDLRHSCSFTLPRPTLESFQMRKSVNSFVVRGRRTSRQVDRSCSERAFFLTRQVAWSFTDRGVLLPPVRRKRERQMNTRCFSRSGGMAQWSRPSCPPSRRLGCGYALCSAFSKSRQKHVFDVSRWWSIWMKHVARFRTDHSGTQGY